jgi:hypothetical protein
MPIDRTGLIPRNLENMHVFVADITKLGLAVLNPYLEKAQSIYDENMNAYINAVLRVVSGAGRDFLRRQGLQLSLHAIEKVLYSQWVSRLGHLGVERSTYHGFAKRATQNGVDICIHVLVVNTLSLLQIWIEHGTLIARHPDDPVC